MKMVDGLEDVKVCKYCGETKPLNLFVKKKDCAGGFSHKCKSCKNFSQKQSRTTSGNFATKKYEKTLKGYLMRTYRNMLNRVNGTVKGKSHLYLGLKILDRDSFYKWSLESNYPLLLETYKESGYNFKLAPSIDRIDSKEGYILGNIRWITHSENSSEGAKSRHNNPTNRSKYE